jgi:LysR family transcriptional regulator, hydrogen peroxide-inducible genes activator
MTPEIATLTLRDLEYIIAIAEQKNFRLAAKACSVSQPALSIQIKKVEEALAVQLFERTNREVLVTPVGVRIAQQCRVILEELEMLGSIARRAEKPLHGSFRLGVIPSLCPYLLPLLQKPLQSRYPNLELVVRESAGSMLLEALRVGRLDAVITSFPIPEKAGNFTVVPLFQEPLLLMVHTASPLAGKKSIKPADLHSEEMVFLDEHFSLTNEASFLLDSTGEHLPGETTFTTTIEAMCFMVASTSKSAVIPFLATKVKRPLTGLEYRSFTGVKPSRTLALVWRPRYSGYQSLTSLADTISEVALKKYPELLRAET